MPAAILPASGTWASSSPPASRDSTAIRDQEGNEFCVEPGPVGR